MFQKKPYRKFNWVSSSRPENMSLLDGLNARMQDFYSKSSTRTLYQSMLDSIDNDLNNPGEMTASFLKYIKSLNVKSLLEVGCGSGRIFQYLNHDFENVDYTGIELSDVIIKENKKKFPGAYWLTAGAYQIPVPTESIDLCFSFYVLEHIVYPEKALVEMLRTVKKGGFLILIFPDFVCSKRFASQRLGLTTGNAKEKIKKGKFIDGLISLYDSRIRLPRALVKLKYKTGSFLVNLSPICLDNNTFMSPDIDAVYISSKQEIEEWAKKNNCSYFLPEGNTDFFYEHAFVSLKKI